MSIPWVEMCVLAVMWDDWRVPVPGGEYYDTFGLGLAEMHGSTCFDGQRWHRRYCTPGTDSECTIFGFRIGMMQLLATSCGGCCNMLQLVATNCGGCCNMLQLVATGEASPTTQRARRDLVARIGHEGHRRPQGLCPSPVGQAAHPPPPWLMFSHSCLALLSIPPICLSLSLSVSLQPATSQSWWLSWICSAAKSTPPNGMHLRLGACSLVAAGETDEGPEGCRGERPASQRLWGGLGGVVWSATF